jgi:glyoxylase-like metal-dependent hydrolase (beta-lactamase superfamily II)
VRQDVSGPDQPTCPVAFRVDLERCVVVVDVHVPAEDVTIFEGRPGTEVRLIPGGSHCAMNKTDELSTSRTWQASGRQAGDRSRTGRDPPGRRLGVRPRDVRHILQTHLDLDHVGGLSDFPWASVRVHPGELEAARARQGVRARGPYRPAMWSRDPKWRTYSEQGEEWNGFGAVRQLDGLPAEILAIPLFGHTRGHCGIAVESASGWVFDAGDAFFGPREVHGQRRARAPRVRLFEAIVTTDRPQRVANQDRLRRLTAEHPEIDVFSAHDPTHPAIPAHAGP